MTRESLRQYLITSIDTILNRPFWSRFLSATDRAVLYAQLEVVTHDDGTYLDKVLAAIPPVALKDENFVPMVEGLSAGLLPWPEIIALLISLLQKLLQVNPIPPVNP